MRFDEGSALYGEFGAFYVGYLDDLNFNYVGPTGILEIGSDGEPVRSTFIRFTYDETGRDVTRESFRHPA